MVVEGYILDNTGKCSWWKNSAQWLWHCFPMQSWTEGWCSGPAGSQVRNLNGVLFWAKLVTLSPMVSLLPYVMSRETPFLLLSEWSSSLSPGEPCRMGERESWNNLGEWWVSWQRICLQCRRPGFHLWVGKIPWRRERLPTPVFCPGEFRPEFSLYIPWGLKESDMTEWLSLSLSLSLSSDGKAFQ